MAIILQEVNQSVIKGRQPWCILKKGLGMRDQIMEKSKGLSNSKSKGLSNSNNCSTTHFENDVSILSISKVIMAEISPGHDQIIIKSCSLQMAHCLRRGWKVIKLTPHSTPRVVILMS